MTHTAFDLPHGWLSPNGEFHDASGRPEYEDPEDIAEKIVNNKRNEYPARTLTSRGWILLNFGEPKKTSHNPTSAQQAFVEGYFNRYKDDMSPRTHAACHAFLNARPFVGTRVQTSTLHPSAG